MPNERVTQLLQDIRLLDAQRFELVQALRAGILELAPSISEEVKYGGILFASERQPFCGIFSYTKHVSLEFGAGSQLPDAWGALEGSGKLRRHIKLYSSQDIMAKHVAHYLALAFEASLADG